MMNETEFLIAFNSAAGAYNAEAGGGSLNPWGYTHVETWEDGATGFKATAYKDASGNYVLAFAGTEDAQDWYQNLASFGWNQWAKTGQEIKLFFQEIKNDEAQELNSIQFTGHSLGGALAQYAAYDFVSAGIVSPDQTSLTTFNALGGEAGLLNEYGIFYDPSLLGSANIHHYYDPSDLVSRLSTHVGGDSTNYQLRSSTDAIFTGDAHFMTTIQGYIADGQLERGLQVSHPYFDIDEVAPALQLWNEVFVGWEGGETEANSVEAAARLGSMIAILPYVFLNGNAEDQWNELKVFLVNNLVETVLADEWGITSPEGKEALKVALDYSFQGLGEALSDGRIQILIQGGTNLTAAFADAYDWLVGDAEIEPSYKALSYSTLNYLVGATLSVDANGHFDEKISEERAREIFSFADKGDNKASFTQLMNFVAQLTGHDLTVNPEAEIALVNSIVENGIWLADFMVPADSYKGERLYNMVTEHAAIPTIIPDPLDARLVRYSIINHVPFILEGVSAEFIDPTILSDAKYSLVEESEQYWNDRIEFFQQALFENANGEETLSGISKGEDKYYWDAEVGDLLVGENTNGQGGNSTLDKTEVSNVVFGGDTADSNIHGYDHDDYLYGRDGDDTLHGRAGRDHIEGNADNDTLHGGADTDYLYGGTGNDQLNGGTDNDFLYGGEGNDTYHYTTGDGNDNIRDVEGEDKISINGEIITTITQVIADSSTYKDNFGNIYSLDEFGEMVIAVSDENNSGTITLGLFNEVTNNFGLTVEGAEVVEAPVLPTGLYDVGAGYFDDLNEDPDPFVYNNYHQRETYQSVLNEQGLTVDLSLITSLWDYDAAYDEIRNESFSPFYSHIGEVGYLQLYFDGTTFDDVLTGGGQGESLDGFLGNDILYGYGGFDVLVGGYGTDTIYGGDQGDWIFGDGNNLYEDNGALIAETIGQEVEHGDDVLFGENGDDIVSAEYGQDYIDGGDGDDQIYGGGGDDQLSGGNHADEIWGDSRIETSDSGFLSNDYKHAPTEGFSFNDILHGGEGDDILVGEIGHDILVGGEGNDKLHGDRTSLTNDAEDDLSGVYHGDDVLDGGAGDDSAKGGGGDDVVLGGAGADLLWGDHKELDGQYHGSDLLKGGEGNDQLIGGGADDVLWGGAGEDLLVGDAGYYSDGTVSVLTDDLHGSDEIHGGDAADQIIGGGAADLIYGDDGDDVIWGDSQVIDGSYRVSETYHGDDTIYGGAGNDSIKGDGGNDTIHGGTGADYLDGGDGNDTFVFLAGDSVAVENARSTVVDDSGVDTINISGSLEDISISKLTNSTTLYIEYGNEDAFFVEDGYRGSIENYVIGGLNYDFVELFLEATEFAVTYIADEENAQLLGGAVDDTLTSLAEGATFYGGTGSDQIASTGFGNTFQYRAGDGNDQINATGLVDDAGQGNEGPVTPPPANKIEFDDSVSSADVSLTVSDSGGLVLKLDDNNSIEVNNFSTSNALGFTAIEAFAFANETLSIGELLSKGFDFTGTAAGETITGTDLIDRISGGGGVDIINAGAGDDHITGGLSDDTLNGGEGINHYYIAEGDGNDYINENGEYHLHLQGSSFGSSQLSYQNSGQHLIVQFGNGQSVMLISYFTDSNPSLAQNINFYFDDSDTPTVALASDIAIAVTTGTDQNDTIFGFITDDDISGGDGADNLFGGEGNDILRGDSGSDTLFGEEGDDHLHAGTGSDTLYGGNGVDHYYFARTDGANTIIDSTGQDIHIHFTDFDYSEIVVQASSSLRLTFDSSGEHYINIDQYFLSGNQDIFFYSNGSATPLVLTASELLTQGSGGTPFDDNLVGDSDSNIIDGYGGNDTLRGMGGEDELYGGDGIDRLYGGSERDELFGENDRDYLYGESGNDVLNGGFGDDLLFGGSEDDVLEGGAGSDELSGGSGSDIYLIGFGDGQDEINDSGDSSTDIGTIRFKSGVRPEDISVAVRQEGSTYNLRFTLLHPTDPSLHASITVLRHVSDSGYAIDRIEFVDDSTVWTVADIAAMSRGQIDNTSNTIYGHSGTDVIDGLYGDDLVNGFQGDDVLTGNHGDDEIYGGDGHDELIGSEGNDKLYGGVGNDTLRGGIGDDDLYGYDSSKTSELGKDILFGGEGADRIYGGRGDDELTGGSGIDSLYGGDGDDTYHFGIGEYSDEIYDSSGSNDRILLGEGVSENDVSLFKQGVSLILVYLPTNEQIEVKSHFSSGAVESIEFSSSGVVWDQAAIASRVNMDGVADSFVGSAGDDTYTVDHHGDSISESTSGGIDTVVANRNYTLDANVENLTLEGYVDNSATGNDLNNILTGNVGNNVLDGGSANSSDYDIAYGGLGDDYYTEIEQVYEYENEGVDTLEANHTGLTLPDNVENLIIRSDYGFVQTWRGNELDNYIENRNRGVEVLFGMGGDDTLVMDINMSQAGRLYGGSGDDRLIASNTQKESQLLDGGEDNDSFILSRDFGGQIIDASGLDRLYFDTGVVFEDITVSIEEADLILSDGSSEIRIINGAVESVVDELHFADQVITWSTLFNNSAPTLNQGMADIEIVEGSSYTVSIDPNMFIDADLDTLDISVTLSDGELIPSSWVNYDGSLITFTPGLSDSGVYEFQITANDGIDQATDHFEVDVLNLVAVPTSYKESDDDGWVWEIVGEGTSGSDYIDIGDYLEQLVALGRDGLRIVAREGNDTIIVQGDAVYYGGAGDDTFVVMDNAGEHEVIKSDDVEGFDVLEFRNGIVKSDVAFTRELDSGSLKINYSTGEGNTSIVFSQFFNQFSADTYKNPIDQITFADGEKLSIQEIVDWLGTPTEHDDDIHGTVEARVLKGLGGNDSITSYQVGDVLDGGVGDDTLFGGGGSDTFVFDIGYDHDTIIAYSNTSNIDHDAVELRGVNNKEDIWFTNLDGRLQMHLLGGNDLLEVDYWDWGSAFQIDEINLANTGESIDVSGIEQLVSVMASFGAPDASGQINLSVDDKSTVDSAIAAAWS